MFIRRVFGLFTSELSSSTNFVRAEIERAKKQLVKPIEHDIPKNKSDSLAHEYYQCVNNAKDFDTLLSVLKDKRFGAYVPLDNIPNTWKEFFDELDGINPPPYCSSKGMPR